MPYQVLIDGVLYAPVIKGKPTRPDEDPPEHEYKSPEFTIGDINSMIMVVVSDMKHHLEPERRELTNDNLRHDFYQHVIRSLFDESTFAYSHKKGGQDGQFIKGYVRDVWSYLADAYTLIHNTDLVELAKNLQLTSEHE
tara:strand:- start:1086 stop:1502 length:417 start_codon:yes stop_codon:yes gene_type:complete